jgi:aconitase B
VNLPGFAAKLKQLLTNPPTGEEQTLLDLITNRVSTGVDAAARLKATFWPPWANAGLPAR